MNINPQQLPKELEKVCGFTQPSYLSDVLPELFECESGIYLDEDQLFNIDNLLDYAVNSNNKKYNQYQGGQSYRLNEIVVDSDIYYKSLINNNTEALTNANAWKVTTLDSDFLERERLRAISTVLSKVFIEKYPIIENKVLYYNRGLTEKHTDTPRQGKFVGFEIMLKEPLTKLKINSLLFNYPITGQAEGLKFVVANTTNPTVVELPNTHNIDGFLNIPIDYEIPFSYNGSNPAQQGSTFYLGYNEGLLSEIANSFKTDNCNKACTKYVQIRPFECDIINGKLDLKNKTYKNLNYGLNIDFGIFLDYDAWAKKYKNLFAQAIQKQFEYNCLKLYQNNNNQRNNAGVGFIENNDYINYQLTRPKEDNTIANQLDRLINDLIKRVKADSKPANDYDKSIGKTPICTNQVF